MPSESAYLRGLFHCKGSITALLPAKQYITKRGMVGTKVNTGAQTQRAPHNTCTAALSVAFARWHLVRWSHTGLPWKQSSWTRTATSQRSSRVTMQTADAVAAAARGTIFSMCHLSVSIHSTVTEILCDSALRHAIIRKLQAVQSS